MSILITGGAGYIGSHAVKRLLRDGNKIVVFDNFSRGHRAVIDILSRYGDLELVEGDLRNEADVEKAFAGRTIDAVFHFAALCSVDESVRESELYFENNVHGTRNLVAAMEKHGVKKLVFSSTCAVYGNAEYVPMEENHPTHPLNPYGESKLKAEEVIREAASRFGLSYAILRYFNVCGADKDGEIGDAKEPSLLLMQNAVRGALGIEPFTLTYPPVDTPDGSPIRDYIDVEDLVDAHVKALAYIEKGVESDVFNIGTGKGSSVLEIVGAVERELGVALPRTKGEERQGESARVYADPKKAELSLGWKATTPITESIKKLARWYRNCPNGYTD